MSELSTIRARALPVVSGLAALVTVAAFAALVSPGQAVAASAVPGLTRPSDAAAFGFSVDISGDTIVVGAPGIGSGSEHGKAYVYQQAAGVVRMIATLAASEPVAKDGFGRSVAVLGDTIVVGSASPYGVPGKAYVFTKPADGWSGTVYESAKLVPAGTAPQMFGMAVDVNDASPAVIAVGDGNQDHVFVEPASGWAGTLTPAATLGSADTGSTIAISGDVIASGDFDGGTHRDVRVFVKPGTGWADALSPTASLTLPSPMARGFGAVAIDGDDIVVGAFGATVGSNLSQGKAYVYRRPVGGWTGAVLPQATLQASDGTAFDEFGFSVASDDGVILVGQPSPPQDGTQNDGVYRFVRPADGWSGDVVETSTLPRMTTSAFGWSVAQDNGVAVVGDQAEGAGNFRGTAFAFLPDGDRDFVSDETDNCPSAANPDQADLDGDGAGDACDVDDDGDSYADTGDNCPRLSNPEQLDMDRDAIGDLCDTANAITVDILPGESPNDLKGSGKTIPVAIMGLIGFLPADRIDQSTLRFGPTGVEAPAVRCTRVDLNRDTIADLLCEFDTKKAAFPTSSTSGSVTGQTVAPAASSFRGTDAVAFGKPKK
jgi:hypothetical protein